MRKTFFSVLIFLSTIGAFSQLRQDTLIERPDCIQFSPLFLLEPNTNCLNISWEHQYNSKIYISGSLGYIFNESNLFDGNNPLEKSGIRLSLDLKRCMHKTESVTKNKKTHFCLGIEPYFKYIKSVQYNNFAIPTEGYKDGLGGYYASDSLAKQYLYTCERMQIGSILKAIIKKTNGKFNIDFEVGARVFYKIVTQGDVDLSLQYMNLNKHAGFDYFYFTRWNYWTVMPFLNIKLGRRF